MNQLHGALRELRVQALTRIARLKAIEADAEAVRTLASRMTDREVLAELRARNSPVRWFFDLFHRRTPTYKLESNSPRDEAERMKWEEEDRQYEEAKAARKNNQISD